MGDLRAALRKAGVVSKVDYENEESDRRKEEDEATRQDFDSFEEERVGQLTTLVTRIKSVKRFRGAARE